MITKKAMGKQQSRDRQNSEVDSRKSKNVNAASVAGNTALQTSEACLIQLTTSAAGVESNPNPEIGKYNNIKICLSAFTYFYNFMTS